jgi:hypothetical protein
MANEKLTSLAKRLRPFILGQMDQSITSVYTAVILAELNRIIYFPIVGGAVLYTKTAANLAIALAGCSSGEWVTIFGPCTLAGDFNIPAGAVLRAHDQYQVTIQGTITLGNGSRIENLSIEKTANSAADIYGVLNSQSGTSYIKDCEVLVTQSGAGNAYALGAINGLSIGDGGVEVHDTFLSGTSVGGSGYAVRSTRGIVKLWGTERNYGSTARYVQT